MALSCSACTRAELVDKANAYDEAIWDSSNKQILLNAVRASQRAPMSFVGFGDVLASPNFSGSAAGTFNLAPSTLSNYSLNPTVSYGGGFSQFTIQGVPYLSVNVPKRWAQKVSWMAMSTLPPSDRA